MINKFAWQNAILSFRQKFRPSHSEPAYLIVSPPHMGPKQALAVLRSYHLKVNAH